MVLFDKRDYFRRDYITLRRAELEESIRFLEFQLKELNEFEEALNENVDLIFENK